MLDPDSFETLEAFRKALLQDGLEKGWKPVSLEFSISMIPEKISDAGKGIVNKILQAERR